MSKFYILILLYLFTLIDNLGGQTNIDQKINDYLNNVNSVSSDYSWIEKHFFHSLSFTGGYLGEVYTMPSKYVSCTLNEERSQWDRPDYEYGELILDNGAIHSIIAVSYEPRLNLYDFSDRAAIALSMPVSVGLMSLMPGSKYRKDDGYCHINIPLVFSYNYGYHSTYNNINNNGFSFGLGGQVIFGPLINGNKIAYIDANEGPVFYYKSRRKFYNVFFRFDYKFEMFDGNIGHLISFSYGIHSGSYYRIAYGLILGY